MDTLNLNISGTPDRTANQLRMEVHMAKRYRSIGIGRYRHLRKTLRSHSSKRLEIGIPNFVCIEIEHRTINCNQENPNFSWTIFRVFELCKFISQEWLKLKGWNFVEQEIWLKAILQNQNFEAGTRFVYKIWNSKAPKWLELELQNFVWK